MLTYVNLNDKNVTSFQHSRTARVTQTEMSDWNERALFFKAGNNRRGKGQLIKSCHSTGSTCRWFDEFPSLPLNPSFFVLLQAQANTWSVECGSPFIINQCSQCGKHFSTSANMKAHINLVHCRNYRYSCPICGKKVQKKSHLNGHMANSHNMPKRFKCDICLKEFGYRHHLTRHISHMHGQWTTSHVISVFSCFVKMNVMETWRYGPSRASWLCRFWLRASMMLLGEYCTEHWNSLSCLCASWLL